MRKYTITVLQPNGQRVTYAALASTQWDALDAAMVRHPEARRVAAREVGL